MEKIIDPVKKELIKSELTVQKRVRITNKANNEIYVFTAHDSPNLMREVGRLREIAFRHYGGGTGLEADIDKYDIMDVPYRQLIVWDPENEEILGGYRFIYGSDVEFDEDANQSLPRLTSTTFRSSLSLIFCRPRWSWADRLSRSNTSPHCWEEKVFSPLTTSGMGWVHSPSLTPRLSISLGK